MFSTIGLLLTVSTQSAVLSPERVGQWSKDLDYLSVELPARHLNLYHTLTPEQFKSAVSKLKSDLPRMKENEVVVELKRIMASVGDRDGHTGVNLTQPSIGFKMMPIYFYLLSDGVFVRAAAKEHESLLGGRVTAIGGTPIDEAVKRLMEIANGDNDFGRRSQVGILLTMPSVLSALKIAPEGESAEVTVELKGEKKTLSIPTVPTLNDVQWTDVRDKAATPPLYRKNAGPNPIFYFFHKTPNWFEILPDKKSMYVHYGAVGDSNGQSVSDFVKSVFEAADGNKIEKLIIDVRANGGGNNNLNWPLVYELIKRPDTLNKRGHLFVLIGRDTFSAAQNFVNLMEKHTQAFFVGEPSGGSPNHFGDASQIRLPNTGISVRCATMWWQDSDTTDHRPFVGPHITAEFSSEDDLNGRDPALLAALNYVEKPRLITELVELAPQGIGAVEKRVQEWMALSENKYANVEASLLGLALSKFNSDPAFATQVFELQTKLFPDSWRAFENLGRAYQAGNKKELAIAAYVKALAIYPKAARSRQSLEALKQG